MEERLTKMETAIQDLQDAAIVMAHLEKRLAETAKEQAARLVALEERHGALEISNAEAHKKLNAIVGIMGNWIKRGAQ